MEYFFHWTLKDKIASGSALFIFVDNMATMEQFKKNFSILVSQY